MDSIAPRPRPVLAVLLGLVCNGLGHAYGGRVGAAIAIFAAWTAVSVGAAFGLRAGPGPALLGLAAMAVLWIGQAVHAGFAARRAPVERATWLGAPLGLLVLFGAATAVNLGLRAATRELVVQTFVMPSGSMLPTLAPGDLFVVARGAPVERGAVVVHAAARGSASSDPVVKRVVAVAGDVVEVRDGRLVLNGAPVAGEEIAGPCTYWAPEPEGGWVERPCRARTETIDSATYRITCAPYGVACGDVAPVQVPPGFVYVLGDHRDNSADSRVYGPIPEASILGRATWIYFSWGQEGVRAERIGLRVR